MKSETVSIDIAASTDVGLVRTNNEDYYLAVDLVNGQVLDSDYQVERPVDELYLLLAVSDGMGGQVAGEVASKLAVSTLCQRLMKLTRRLTPYDRLVQAVEHANAQVYQESRRNTKCNGMGATLTAALVEGDQIYIAEVGDSRAYLLRNGRIKQVTTDQSLIEILVSRGLLSAQDAERSTNRGVLLQAIGTKEEIQVAVTSLPLLNKDCLLLCSDGLSNKVSDIELLEVIANHSNLQDACEELIQIACQSGGEDNITALIAQFNGEGLASHSSGKITTTLQALSTFDPDRPRSKKRTQRLSSVPANKTLVFPSTVGINTPSRDLINYPRYEELLAEFERLAYHLEKAQESLGVEMKELKGLAEWLQQGGALDARLPDVFAKLRSAQTSLEQVRTTVTDAKERFKKKN
ncbi:MAG: Stp1/IreP family PP2C-type Ser/Thr phosphatase [Acidobacteriota bacterium]